MKLKYRITIGNVLVLVMVLFSIFTVLTSKDPNNRIGANYILFCSIFIFLGDLFLQWLIVKRKKILIIEGVVLSILFILLAIT